MYSGDTRVDIFGRVLTANKRKLPPPRKVTPFDERIWGPEDRSILEPYAEWHAKHPLCESPRPVNGKEGPGVFAGELAIDDDDPGRVYHVNLFEKEPPPELLPNYLGAEAQFDEVSIVATEVETQLRENMVEEFDDPWWLMSVRETKTLRTPKDHYDDGRSLTSDMKALEKQVAFKTAEEEKQIKLVEKMRAEKMEELALAAQWGKKPRQRKSAWATEVKPNRYITGHTKVFEKYDTIALKKNVDAALKQYIEDASVEKKRALNEPEPEYERDRYAEIKERLGGDAALEEMAAKWSLLAANAKKYGEADSGALNPLNAFSLDFIEACEMGNVVKAASLLAVGKGDPNSRIGDDPILVYIFHKILDIDVLYTPTEVELAVLADADMKLSKKMSKRITKRGTFLANFGGGQDSGRKNYMKIIAVLAKFKADLDALGGDNFAPIHLAGQYNNATLAKWLLERGANPNIRAHTLIRETAMMVAARYGAVPTIAALVMHDAKMTDADDEGNTALHYAAQYGQTLAAQFLLRVGFPKTLKNNEGKLAAECAIEGGFHSTAQAIMGYAKPLEKVGPILEYLTEQMNQKEPVTLMQGIANAFKQIEDAFKKFSLKGLWNGLLYLRGKIIGGCKALFRAVFGKKKHTPGSIKVSEEAQQGDTEGANPETDPQNEQHDDVVPGGETDNNNITETVENV